MRSKPGGAVAVALLLILGGCGDDEDDGLFTTELAESVAKAFCVACMNGDAEAALRLSRAPFTFRGRVWKDEAALRRNLPRSLAALKDDLAEAEAWETLTWRDLREGRWPRGENVPEGDRDRRLDELRVGPDGFLLRAYKAPKTGVLIALSAERGSRLVVRGIH